MNLILLGPPGAGKGTQAKRIERFCGASQLSASDLLREAIGRGGAVGRKIKAIMARGELVPDGIMVDLISARIDSPQCTDGFILDGFPRNIVQAEALERLIEKQCRRIDAAIQLEIDNTVSVARIENRVREAQDGLRIDDNVEVLEKRLEVYHRQTAPLIAYYDKRGLLKKIDGAADIETVGYEIEGVLGELGVRDRVKRMVDKMSELS